MRTSEMRRRAMPRRARQTVFVLAAAAAMLGGASAWAADDEKGFTNLTGADAREHWLGYGLDDAKDTWPATWDFEDGVLHAQGGNVDLKTREQYADFDLRFEWKSPPGGNSGVMFRVSQEKDPAYHTGPEFQIHDKKGNEAVIVPETSTGSIYALYAPTKELVKPAGEWNSGRIVLVGSKLEHYINGEKVLECELGSDDWNRRVAASKFDPWKKFGRNARGALVLQDHGDEVWFRNVRVKSLDKGGAK